LNQSDLNAALPLIILAGTGLLVLLWDAFEKTPSRIPLYLTILGAGAAGVLAAMNMGVPSTLAFGGLYFNNSYSNFFTIVFSAAIILTVLLAERYLHEEEVLIGEFCALVLFSSSGMMMMASGADLLVSFLGLETMSIAFYVLAGLFRKKEASNEAALKYFLLGAFATGFFLYGIALIYGSFGTMNLAKIHGIISDGGEKMEVLRNSPMLLLGLVLIIVGLSFKVAAFPFHQWAPDVYEGAPTIVAGFMSTAGKAAAFSAFVIIFALIPVNDPNLGLNKIAIIFGVLAAVSMLYGNIVALAQTKIKRMLAYSSTAHAGYLLLGVASLNSSGAEGVAIYAAVYLLMQIAAFGIVAMLEKETGTGLELNDYIGLAKRRPWAAFLLSVIMLSLAGIPPFAGFFGKYYLFLSAISAGMTWLAIIGVISSIIASYFYLRVIVLMYFREPLHAQDETNVTVKENSLSYIVIGLASVALVILGLMPGLLTGMAGYFFK
jgi:NADH-quinone oxidoreductase subunit N